MPTPNSADRPRVFAITVNWNRPVDTLACIASLLAQTPCAPEIVVVDNGSADDSVAQIRAQYPNVRLIASPTNLGFGRGNNLGIREALTAGADFVFLINNDAILAPDGLAKMLEQASPAVGMIAPLIYYAAEPGRIWSSGGMVNPWLLEKTGDHENQADHGDWPPVIERDFITGCGMLIPRGVLETVGMFDEGFQMYYEDADLCYRVRAAGYRVLVAPGAKMLHKVSTSSGGRDTPNERYWMGRSSVQFFGKHARGWQFGLIVPYRLGSALRTTFRLLRRRKPEAAQAYWRGIRDGLAAVRASRAG